MAIITQDRYNELSFRLAKINKLVIPPGSDRKAKPKEEDNEGEFETERSAKGKKKEVDADEENERNRERNFSRTQRSIETGGT